MCVRRLYNMRGQAGGWMMRLRCGNLASECVLPKEHIMSISGINPLPLIVTTNPHWTGPDNGEILDTVGADTTFNGKTKPEAGPGTGSSSKPTAGTSPDPWHVRTSTLVAPTPFNGMRQVAI